MKKFIYMVASLAFLTACHSTATTENKVESTQIAATTEQTTVTTQKSNGEADLSLGIQMVVNKKHKLPADYNPGENPIAGEKVRKLIQKMQELGFSISNQYSGFRSYEYQTQLYQNYVNKDGKEAADTAGKTHRVRYGVFDEMNFGDERYDLIIFRGVLQYVPNPKSYLRKAASILNNNNSAKMGCLFITAQPNVKSLGFRLFGKNFTQPVTGADFIGLHEHVLTEYMVELGMRKVGERYFYSETPYADEENDLLKMARAIQYRHEGKPVDFKAPAYWGNMMTLMYSL